MVFNSIIIITNIVLKKIPGAGMIFPSFVEICASTLRWDQLQVFIVSPASTCFYIALAKFSRSGFREIFIRGLCSVWGGVKISIIVFPDDIYCFGLGDLDSQCFVRTSIYFLIKTDFL